SFVTLRHTTAGSAPALMEISGLQPISGPAVKVSVTMALPSENHRRLQDQNAANAQEARKHDDQKDGHARAHHDLPEHVQPGQRSEMAGGFEKDRGQADSKTVPDSADQQCLEQDHADDAEVGHSHRFEGTELLEIFEGEQIERLSGNGYADD